MNMHSWGGGGGGGGGGGLKPCFPEYINYATADGMMLTPK